MSTDHMHHTSCIMCIVTVWHPSIGNIIPISGYVTLDTPVTVVTSGELRNQNQAVSETKTWQPYGAIETSLVSVYTACTSWLEHSGLTAEPEKMELIFFRR